MKRRDFAKLSLGAGAGLHVMPTNFLNLESNFPFKKSDFKDKIYNRNTFNRVIGNK